MNKKYFKQLTIVFSVYLVSFLVLMIFMDDKDFSDLENRYLAQKPSVSIESIINRTFSNDFENYISDQFPFRDNFITLKSLSEVLQGKNENNGVYLCKDGSLIEKISPIDYESMEIVLKYMNDFSKKFNTYVMVAPTSYTINSDVLPNFVDKTLELSMINEFCNGLDDNIEIIDLVEYMKQYPSNDLYYRTDHHWNINGARAAYEALCLKMDLRGITDYGSLDYVEEDGFYGTLYSKGNYTWLDSDKIALYRGLDCNVNSVNYVYSDKTSSSMYEMKYLDEKDKYGVFLDNNHPLIKIETNSESSEKILLIKDSYANSLIPFMTQNFKEIHVVDLRFFKGSVYQYMIENKINDVLFMYNIRNIVGDRNMVRLSK